LLGQALGNKQIAAALDLSPYTVRNRLHDLYGRFGVNDRAELLKWAYERGLIEPPRRRS
jgi:DNA-binding NarL/FixJ family response regulator